MRCAVSSRVCNVVSPVSPLFVGSFPKEERERSGGDHAAGLCCRRSLEEKRRLACRPSSRSETSQTRGVSASSP